MPSAREHRPKTTSGQATGLQIYRNLKSSVTDINGVVTETFGDYSGMGGCAYFWSSTEGDSYYALFRVLSDNGSEVIRYVVSKGFGLSVRCVRD